MFKQKNNSTSAESLQAADRIIARDIALGEILAALFVLLILCWMCMRYAYSSRRSPNGFNDTVYFCPETMFELMKKKKHRVREQQLATSSTVPAISRPLMV